MTGLTLDTGALIALERRDRRMTVVFARAIAGGVPLTIPSVVLVEWWRGASSARRRILDATRSRPTWRASPERRSARSGPGPSAVDAVVMASAATRGDLVYTGDLDDLGKLRICFPAVRLLAV